MEEIELLAPKRTEDRDKIVKATCDYAKKLKEQLDNKEYNKISLHNLSTLQKKIKKHRLYFESYCLEELKYIEDVLEKMGIKLSTEKNIEDNTRANLNDLLQDQNELFDLKLRRLNNKYKNPSYDLFKDEKVDNETINKLVAYLKSQAQEGICLFDNFSENIIDPEVIEILGKEYVEQLKKFYDLELEPGHKKLGDVIKNIKKEKIRDVLKEIDQKYTYMGKKIIETIRLYDLKILEILINNNCKNEFDLDDVSHLQLLNESILKVKQKEKFQHKKGTWKVTKDFDKNIQELLVNFTLYPNIILPILLWFDSIHDFGNDNRTDDKINNSIKFHNNKTFINFYIDKFFIQNTENVEFSDQVDTTILKVVKEEVKNDELGNLIDLPSLLKTIATNLPSNFEKQFFYMYVAYFFNFDKKKINDSSKAFINDTYYKNHWIDYTTYFPLWKSIDLVNVWTQDFSKDAQKLSQLKLNEYFKTYIPSSLADANTQTSTDFFGDYYSTNDSLHYVVWSGQNFNYTYNKHNCLLTVSSTGINDTPSIFLKSNCETIIPLQTSTGPKTISDKLKTNFFFKNKNDPYIYPYILGQKKIDLKNIDKLLYSNKSSGVSVAEVYALIVDFYNKDNTLSLAMIDSLLSLKRIGDLGQIFESKILNIPFFTDDKMEALISLAMNATTITSCDNYLLLYSREKEAFLSPITYYKQLKNECEDFDVKRKEMGYEKKLSEIQYGSFKIGDLDKKAEKKIKEIGCLNR